MRCRLSTHAHSLELSFELVIYSTSPSLGNNWISSASSASLSPPSSRVIVPLRSAAMNGVLQMQLFVETLVGDAQQQHENSTSTKWEGKSGNGGREKHDGDDDEENLEVDLMEIG